VNPNGDGNIGQGATFSSVAFTGFDTPLFIGSFSDNFMNLDNWTIAVAQDDTGIQLRPADTKLKIAWPSSADGFVFQSRSQFGAGSWADAGLPIYASTGRRAVFLNGAGNASFFRLAKP